MKLARARQTIGLSLMSASLLVAVVAAPTAVAAEGDEEDKEAAENAETIEELPREAFWNTDQSAYADNAATRTFPPESVCLVQPQACNFPEGEQDPSGDLGLGSEGNDLLDEGGRLNSETQDQVRDLEDEHVDEPENPVPPDSLPVSIANGQPNYRSAVLFDLPGLPAGHEIDSLHVVLEQSEPTYYNESPALRQAVLAALTCAQENEEPQGRCTREEVEKVPRSCEGSETPEPCFRQDTPLLVEACPIADEPSTEDVDEGAWESGRAQDEDTLPHVECLYGAQGVQVRLSVDGAEKTFWVFDLTFAANEWYGEDGSLPNRGVLLRPGAAENFAYGDKESTYSKQVTFTNTVGIAATSSEPPELLPLPDFNSTGQSQSSSTGGSSDLFATPQQPTSSSASMPSGGDSGQSAQAPSVSTDATTDGSEELAGEQLAANTPLGEPETPWWLWLLLPMFILGAYLLNESLTEAAVAGRTRSGAMTRLLERQAAARSPELVTG